MLVNIKADFTCDNSYAIWTGDQNSVQTKITQATNTQAAQISNGEHINFTALKPEYLYVIAWSDDRGVQGLLGTFDGGVKSQMGDPAWKVLPTGLNKGNSQFPTQTEINNALNSATTTDWKQPFVGPTNLNTNQLFVAGSKPVKGIDLNANWVWHNSGKDKSTTPGGYKALPPFKGFNHDEVLIFRLPVKNLTSCNVCDSSIEKEQKELKERTISKTFTIKGSNNNAKRCNEPYSKKTCSLVDLPELEPCFYMHWGDSKKDQIESHDDEILYITACNPYGNLSFRGLKVIKATITPSGSLLSNGEKEIQLVPDKLICFGDLEGCACSSREFTLLTRGVKPDNYKIEIEYCIDSIEINQYNTGKTSFPFEVINS